MIVRRPGTLYTNTKNVRKIQFYAITTEIKAHTSIHQFFENLKIIAKDRPGFCAYKYPLAGSLNRNLPDLTIVDEEYGICILNFITSNIEGLEDMSTERWKLSDKYIDSPLLELEDHEILLKSRYEKYRHLRKSKVAVNSLLILSLINKSDFTEKFTELDASKLIFNNFLEIDYESLWINKSELTGDEKRLFIAVSQGAGPLNSPKSIESNNKASLMGEAIRLLDTKLSELDKIQHAAAIQIPDGPQRIRGMAGTGKTIILTMKAAFLHSSYPDKKILYTLA